MLFRLFPLCHRLTYRSTPYELHNDELFSCNASILMGSEAQCHIVHALLFGCVGGGCSLNQSSCVCRAIKVVCLASGIRFTKMKFASSL